MNIGYGVSVLSRGLLASGVDGIGTYTKELSGELTSMPDVELLPVSFGYNVDTGIAQQGQGLTLPSYLIMAPICACFPIPFAGHSELKSKVDIFHATDHLIPRFPSIPVLATLMDAVPLSHPEWVKSRGRSLKALLWRRAAQWADHVVTISEYSKKDIVEQFSIPPEKISVVPLGVDRRYFEVINQQEKLSVLEKLHLPQKFFLFIGTLQPRKNIERILLAHASLPLEMQREFPMVIVGRAGWGVDALLEKMVAAEFTGTVRWLKYLRDFEARALMQSASALVFPSLYEGYGLPVVEAFASQLPVITSNTTALPEVAEDAALMVDPLDIDAIADAMQQIILNPEITDKMRKKGFLRAQESSWAACAQQTVALYQKLLGVS